MTETPHPNPNQPPYPPQPPPWMPPHAGPPPLPMANGPTKKPGTIRRGTVTVAAVATLVAGALGGTVGALVAGHDGASTPLSTAAAASPVSASAPTDLSSVIEKVLPTVVQVNMRAGNEQGIGSGVILSADGKILTNNHVVSGAQSLTVTLSDGRTVDASVIRTDPTTDLALIQAQGVSGLTAATLGDSSGVKIGDEVIAIGSPGGLQGTVTTGIVSALDREVTVSGEQQRQEIPFSRNSSGSTVTYHAIQTDAAINQGNSGGPLFNAAGQVIGVNSAIYSPVTGADGSAGSVGIGFSIPINQAKEVIG